MHARRDEARVVATSLIAYVETRAGLARRRAAGDVSSVEHRRIVEAFDEDWDRLLRLELSERLVADAAALAEKHRLRAYDAVHLASAKALAAEPGDHVTFASWDRPLYKAASHEGLALLRV